MFQQTRTIPLSHPPMPQPIDAKPHTPFASPNPVGASLAPLLEAIAHSGDLPSEQNSFVVPSAPAKPPSLPSTLPATVPLSTVAALPGLFPPGAILYYQPDPNAAACVIKASQAPSEASSASRMNMLYGALSEETLSLPLCAFRRAIAGLSKDDQLTAMKFRRRQQNRLASHQLRLRHIERAKMMQNGITPPSGPRERERLQPQLATAAQLVALSQGRTSAFSANNRSANPLSTSPGKTAVSEAEAEDAELRNQWSAQCDSEMDSQVPSLVPVLAAPTPQLPTSKVHAAPPPNVGPTPQQLADLMRMLRDPPANM